MRLNLDLHTHSGHSHDGRMTLDEMTRTASSKGLDAIAVTDHDTVFSGPLELNGVLVIPGVEFSTQRGHLLGLFVNADIIDCREFEQAVSAVHACGGITVLAHPFQHSLDESRLLPLLEGLDGMEVWNGRANRKNHSANDMAKKFALEHGLRPFAGSDAHLPEEIGNGTVTVEAEERSLPAIRKALLSGDVTVTGREGRDLCVARSQYTKLVKTHAGLLRRCKWAAFAGKCLAEDLFRRNRREFREDFNVTDR